MEAKYCGSRAEEKGGEAKGGEHKGAKNNGNVVAECKPQNGTFSQAKVVRVTDVELCAPHAASWYAHSRVSSVVRCLLKCLKYRGTKQREKDRLSAFDQLKSRLWLHSSNQL